MFYSSKSILFKNILLSLSALVCVQSSLSASEKVPFYLGAGLGIMAVPENVDAGVGLVLKSGVSLNSVLENLGAEAEIQKSIIHPEYGRSNDVDILTFAGYATYNIEIPSSEVTVRPRFGVILPNLGDVKSVNSRNYSFSSGLDVVYKVSTDLKIYGSYTNLGEYINSYVVGTEFHF